MCEKAMADPNNVQKMNLETDLDHVTEFWLHEAKKSHRLIPETYWDSRINYFRDETKNLAKERFVYKDKKEEIRGFITAREDGYIFEVYIVEDFRGQGIGTALLITLRGENPKFPQLKDRYSCLTSHVYAHNNKGFPWHIKNNFKITGIHFCPDTGLPKFAMKWEKK